MQKHHANLVIIMHLPVGAWSINSSLTGFLTGRGGVSTMNWLNLFNGCGFVLSVLSVCSTNSSTSTSIFDKLFAVCFPVNTQRVLTLNTATELLVDSFHYRWLPVCVQRKTDGSNECNHITHSLIKHILH